MLGCVVIGSDILELEVARTCNVLTPVMREPGAGSPLYSGYLWKLGGLSNGAKWVQRWFSLKRDNCLYYYKNDTVWFCSFSACFLQWCSVHITGPFAVQYITFLNLWGMFHKISAPSFLSHLG